MGGRKWSSKWVKLSGSEGPVALERAERENLSQVEIFVIHVILLPAILTSKYTIVGRQDEIKVPLVGEASATPL